MRSTVSAILALLTASAALSGPAIVDIALGDQDGAIYVDPALISRDSHELRPHVGDLNGDGSLDIVVAHPTATWAGTSLRGVAWVAFGPVLGLERDLVSRPSEILFAGSAVAPPNDQGLGQTLVIADFNGDGRDDIVIQQRGNDSRCASNFTSCSSLYLYFGSSLPAFIDPEVQLPDVRVIGGMIRAIDHAATADLDRDGFADLLLQSGTKGDPALSGSGVIYGRAAWPYKPGTGPTQTWTYLTANRLLSDSTWTYAHDLNGNVTSKSSGPSTFNFNWQLGPAPRAG